MAKLTTGQIYYVARQAGFSPSQSVVMTAIALAESGGDPGAQHVNSNGTIDYGLWQINQSNLGATEGPTSMLVASNNAKKALDLFKGPKGLKNWTTYTSGAYATFLPAAQAAQAGKPEPVGTGFDNPIAGVTDTVKSGVQASQDLTQALNSMGQWITNRQNWVRIIEVVLGGALILTGLTILARPAIEPTLKTVGKVL